jgi:hypothetical protein
MREQNKIKPYYLVSAFSKRARRQQTDYRSNEMTEKNRLVSLKEAKRRSVEYAASLNEINSMGANDWQPVVRVISDKGKFIVQ